jgi:hypothetical protein
VWDAIRDIGALHTRLVPGFVIDTRLEPGVRVVTFGDCTVVTEPIVDIDEHERRLVWGAIGGPLTTTMGPFKSFPRQRPKPLRVDRRPSTKRSLRSPSRDD